MTRSEAWCTEGGCEWEQSSNGGFYWIDCQSSWVESSYGTKQKKARVHEDCISRACEHETQTSALCLTSHDQDDNLRAARSVDQRG